MHLLNNPACAWRSTARLAAVAGNAPSRLMHLDVRSHSSGLCQALSQSNALGMWPCHFKQRSNFQTSTRPTGSRKNTKADAIAGSSETQPNCKQLLYVDALNYADNFFLVQPSHWEVAVARSEVQRFVAGARNSGFELTAYIDAAMPTEEAMSKWRSRREAEVQQGSRKVPVKMGTMLEEMFREAGVPVVLSCSHDADATLAAHAQLDGAAILSSDRDFFRYRGAQYKVYGNYSLEGSASTPQLRLHASRHSTPKQGVSSLGLPTDRPTSAKCHQCLAPLVYAPGPEPTLWMGSPSPLTRTLGNLHKDVRPLRHALYLHLLQQGVSSQQGGLLQGKKAVLECWPEWCQGGGMSDASSSSDSSGYGGGSYRRLRSDDGHVRWHEERVDLEGLQASTPEYVLQARHLLEKPQEAVHAMFPTPWPVQPSGVDETTYYNHIYAMHALVYELCSIAHPDRFTLTQLVMEQAAAMKAGT